MHFTAAVRDLPPRGARRPSGMIRESSSLSALRCLELFDAQLASRHIDTAARWLQAEGAGFYTIGSSGHEGNAGLAAALRLTDPALLHYRSGAFYLVRAAPGQPAAGRRQRRAARARRRGRRARSPAAGTRSSATPAERDPADLDHRLAPARASAWPSPGAGGQARGPGALARRRHRRLQLRRRLGRTTPPPPGRSIPPPTAATRACRCRCCWSARTTAWASACGRRPAGSRPRSRDGRASSTSMRTEPIWPTSTTPRPMPPRGSGTGGSPRSCTLRWCGSAGMPARMSRPRTAGPARSPPTWTVTRCSARPGCWPAAAYSPRTRSWTGTRHRGSGCWRWPRAWSGRRGWPPPPR